MTCGSTRLVAATLLVLLVVGSTAGATVTGALPSDSDPTAATVDRLDAASVADDPAKMGDPLTASTADGPVLADAAAATDRSTIHLDQTLHRLPDRAGEYEADNRYRLPDHAVKLEVTVRTARPGSGLTGSLPRATASTPGTARPRTPPPVPDAGEQDGRPRRPALGSR